MMNVRGIVCCFANEKEKLLCLEKEGVMMFQYSRFIHVRRTMKEDIEFIYNMERENENVQFIVTWSKEQHEASLTDEDILHFIIEDKESHRCVGYMILAGLQSPNDSVELVRIVIGPKGKGYGKAAFRLIKNWVFHHQKANRLWLDVKVHNTCAIHLYKTQGFTIEGTLRECLKDKEGYESLHIMSLLRDEYLEADLDSTPQCKSRLLE